MTKKHYVVIAKLLLDYRMKHTVADRARDDAFVRDLVLPLMRALAGDNERFDYGRFLGAVGVEKE